MREPFRPRGVTVPGPASRPELPPGPRLPALVQTVLFKNHRHRTMPWVRRRYGDVVRMRFVPNGRVVMLMDVGLVREVFAGDVEVFHGGEGNDIVKPVMGEYSIMLSDGDGHRRIRSLLTPAFSGAAVRRYRDRITEVAAAEAADWPTNRVFASLQRMREFTLEVLLRVVLGFEPGDRLAELRTLMTRFVDIGALDILGFHSPVLQRFGRWRRKVAEQARIDELLFAEIAARRADPSLAERTDVLSALISTVTDGEPPLSDRELRDQLVSLILAGQETSATALSWAFHELAHDPALQERAANAAQDDALGLLEAIVKESLRRHTVVTDVGRTLTCDIEIGGYRVPAGYDVMIGIDMVHRDGAHHPCPHRFDPDRFTDDSDGRVTPGTWLPFGGGARRCLGAGFALLEGTILLREVLLRYRLEPGSPERERTATRHVILVPERGAEVLARPRDDIG